MGEGLGFITVPAPARRPEAVLAAARTAFADLRCGRPTEEAVSSLSWLPSAGPSYVCLGATRALAGPLESAVLRREASDLLSTITSFDHPSLKRTPRPRLFGGFAFAPGAASAFPWEAFGDGRLVLPRWCYGCQGERAWLSLTIEGPLDGEARARLEEEMDILGAALEDRPKATPPAADVASLPDVLPTGGRGAATPADPVSRSSPQAADGLARERWERTVEEILRAIDAGEVSKVVLARRSMVEVQGATEPASILEALGERYPGCTRFCVEAGGAWFLGATPERLVRKRGRAVTTEALAGSAGPGEGADLLEDPKIRLEHELVLADMMARLAPLCEGVQAGEPELLELSNVVHRKTSLRAEAREEVSVLDVVVALHPTPAVGGVPREVALRWIAKREPDARGWYAGPLGWLDASGDGEFIVALRSGLVCDGRAWLFAGAGIVRGSRPADEFDETEIKLRAMREALEATARPYAVAALS
jgi:menaquinone-specific isochorismate synthase